METIISDVRHFIVENFLFGNTSERFAFSDDHSLQDRGIVDSTGILELVSFLEETYDISIDDHELHPDNLDSVARIARFVERKRQSISTTSRRAS